MLYLSPKLENGIYITNFESTKDSFVGFFQSLGKSLNFMGKKTYWYIYYYDKKKLTLLDEITDQILTNQILKKILTEKKVEIEISDMSKIFGLFLDKKYYLVNLAENINYLASDISMELLKNKARQNLLNQTSIKFDSDPFLNDNYSLKYLKYKAKYLSLQQK